MRILPSDRIEAAVGRLCVQANMQLRSDVRRALEKAARAQTDKRSRSLLEAILENAAVASGRRLAICQDTGIPIVFVEMGNEVFVRGDLNRAINAGIVRGYHSGFLRASVVQDPLTRRAARYTPAVVHVDIVRGSSLKLSVMPKGFGCENKSSLRMFKPTDSLDAVSDFIVDTVRLAGPDACPPYVVGVGIGGTADAACLMAKKALLRKIGGSASHRVTASPRNLIQILEKKILRKINRLKIGPMGLGGKTTALDVLIETAPTHIAGLPVAVNLSCHALRSASITL